MIELTRFHEQATSPPYEMGVFCLTNGFKSLCNKLLELLYWLFNYNETYIIETSAVGLPRVLIAEFVFSALFFSICVLFLLESSIEAFVPLSISEA